MPDMKWWWFVLISFLNADEITMLPSEQLEYQGWLAIRDTVKPALAYEPLTTIVTVSASDQLSGLSTEVLIDLETNLRRFQNFYDDLRVLGLKVDTKQFARALQHAHRELTSEATRMSQKATANREKVLQTGLMLRDIVVGDACIQSSTRHTIKLCRNYYFESETPGRRKTEECECESN